MIGADAGRGQDAAPQAADDFLGRVLSVRGSNASVGLEAPSPQYPQEARATVGRFLTIRAGDSVLVGVITDVRLSVEPGMDDRKQIALAQMDLIGEIQWANTPTPRFRRGVSRYPAIGDPVGMTTSADLRLIFDVSSPDAIEVGRLQQDKGAGAFIKTTDMLSKHFAILGTTGVGKSSAVALLIQNVLRVRPDLRILLLDAHNEYGRCFGDKALVLNPRNLRLPFWLFNFEEVIDIFFGGRPAVEEEIDLLAEAIPLARAAYAHGGSFDRLLIKKNEPGGVRFTADIPLPYRMSDLLSLLDARMGKLENRSLRMVYHRLIARIESVSDDPRYAFIFENANVGGDTMAEVLSTVFRLPPDGVPVTIMQLAGFPSEVVDAVVSVLCRMAFDLGLWSDGADPLLIVCEEAHRYMAADRNVGFGPTRRAISRIAKEGRKYGVFLGLVTQRPAELDPTILSQCSTLFAMRMTNDRDQALLRSAVADSATNLLSFLPSLGTGETFAFGEGVALPTRLRFTELPPALLPRNEAAAQEEPSVPGQDRRSLAAVIERWRGIGLKPRKEEEAVPQIVQPAAQTSAARDPELRRLVRTALDERAASPGATPRTRSAVQS